MPRPTKYLEVKKKLLEWIEDESIQSGDKLPSVREISNKLQCSKTTVLRAYKSLENEHRVYVIPNSGYYYIGAAERAEPSINSQIDFRTAVPEKNLMPYRSFEHSIKRAVELHKELLFTYGKSEGLDALRETLKRHLSKRQVYCHAKDIYITSGAQQALYLLLKILKKPDKDMVVVEAPTYSGFLRMAEKSPFVCQGIERTSKGLDFKSLEALFKTGRVAFFYTVPNHHNPLGTSLRAEEKMRILKLANKYNVDIIEDDYLGDLNLDPKNYPLHYYDTEERVIYISSFSKSFMPGIRIGMMVLPKQFSQAYLSEKHACDISTSILAQGGLQLYIESGMYDNHIRKVRKTYIDKMKHMKKYSGLLESMGVKIEVPITGIFVWLDLPKQVNAHRLENKLQEMNVHVYSGRRFYIDEKPGKNAVRLCLAHVGTDLLDQGLKTIIEEIKRSKALLPV